jgi:hypothetical protein
MAFAASRFSSKMGFPRRVRFRSVRHLTSDILIGSLGQQQTDPARQLLAFFYRLVSVQLTIPPGFSRGGIVRNTWCFNLWRNSQR